MQVRLAYGNQQISICRKHYNHPPADCPPLGEVRDARSSGCVCCDQEHRAKLLARVQAAAAKPVAERKEVERDLVRAATVLDGLPLGRWATTEQAWHQMCDWLPSGIAPAYFEEVMYAEDTNRACYVARVRDDG